MSVVRFIGCLHLGHENMARHHRGFPSSYHHDEKLIHDWNLTVGNRDLTYILGDVTMETSEFYYKLDRLNGRKKVVLGNHDRGRDIPELLKYVETVEGMVHYKGFWLSHCPVHPQELSFVRGNIHAHVHNQKVVYSEVKVDYWDKKDIIKSSANLLYYNVDAQIINFRPKSIEELLNEKDISSR